MVKYEPWDSEVSDIKGKMDRGELRPDPDWQRGYIWKLKDEQLLIDSILNEIPIPKFYLTVEYDPQKGANIYNVVDGQQRLTAIHRFLNNKFFMEIQKRPYLFKDLDKHTQERITTYRLNGHYMKDFNQSDINFLFQRLNRTGIKLSNMEEWNNEFTGSNILKLSQEILKEHKDFYMNLVYTEEDIKRMLPLDDILDLCNCLKSNSIQSGGKSELQSFLKNSKDLSNTDSSILKSKFRKTIYNIADIFAKQDLESSLYGKRTHFISFFLAIGFMIRTYYILANKNQLKSALLDFIVNQPEAYRESVQGAIRQKAKRETRVKLIQGILLKYAKPLDGKRLFDEALKQKLWHKESHLCPICDKQINTYVDATIDHIEPWAKGGRTIESNARLTHTKCNLKKKDSSERFIIL